MFVRLSWIQVNINTRTSEDGGHMKLLTVKVNMQFESQVLVDRTQHPPIFHFFFHFHGLEICKTAIMCRFLMYQSTDGIRKRHLYIHISRLMQSENSILLLFYIFLSHGNGEKKRKRGHAVSCPQAPVV
jgi:hypothetical protein